MPRGGHKVKPVKAIQVDTSSGLHSPDVSSPATKSTRTNTDLWRATILASTFLSRSSSETKQAGPVPGQPVPVRESSCERTTKVDASADSKQTDTGLKCGERRDATLNSLNDELESPVRPTFSRQSSMQSEGEDATFKAALDTFESLNTEATQSRTSSICSRDSASIFSSASSIYSSGASIYSFDECTSEELDRRVRKASTELITKDANITADSRLQNGPLYQQRAHTFTSQRQEPQDAASRERSTLAKKAALFKNSRLPPHLPSFSTSLPMWSMVCRAAQASQDCYDSRVLTRRGMYTPADSSKDIKAMIIDDQLIDDSRLVIVSIRGTQCQSLADWTVNIAANPTKPVGFMDDEENACHGGFLQVTKAMVNRVAAQLQQHPASSERPSLLFTGHSAGGAIAAMLYSHMLSTSVYSDLTALASQFSSVNCVTFGAPPLSLTPLPRRDHGSGVFLAFANEGDPVLRLSNAAYVKSLTKLMTASSPSSATPAAVAPPVKVVRGSRGAAAYRQILPAPPPTPWEELPLWPTPPTPLFNAGDIILLRDKDNGNAVASCVTPEDLGEVIFGDLAQHTIEMYIRRVKELALAAMMGKFIQ